MSLKFLEALIVLGVCIVCIASPAVPLSEDPGGTVVAHLISMRAEQCSDAPAEEKQGYNRSRDCDGAPRGCRGEEQMSNKKNVLVLHRSRSWRRFAGRLEKADVSRSARGRERCAC